MTALAWEDTSSWFLPAPTFPVALLWVTGKTQQALEGQDHTADDCVLELHTLHLPHKIFPAVKKTTAKTSSFKNSRQVQPTRRWTEPQRYLLYFFSHWSSRELKTSEPGLLLSAQHYGALVLCRTARYCTTCITDALLQLTLIALPR